MGVPQPRSWEACEPEPAEDGPVRNAITVDVEDYYQVFAGFRFSVIMMRLAQQMVEYSVMDEEAGRNFELNNTVTRLLAKLLELPPPGASMSPSFHD